MVRLEDIEQLFLFFFQLFDKLLNLCIYFFDQQVTHIKFNQTHRILLQNFTQYINYRKFRSHRSRMKRKSDLAKHQLLKNFPHHDSEFDYARKQAKRNFTTFIQPNQNPIIKPVSQSFTRNQWIHAQTVATYLVNDLINYIDRDIQIIENRKMIASAICLTNSIAHELQCFQDPQKSINECSPLPESQPLKNITDPISGFNKQSLIKKSNLRQKIEHDTSISSIKDPFETTNSGFTQQKKLPPLMKQLSEQKLQVFVPLDEGLGRKHSTIDFEDMVRERFLKEIENRKLKQKIQAISSGVANQKSDAKKNSRSSHGQQKQLPKQDLNFDYDGNKISILTHGKVKSNLKILKTLYKMPKQRGDQQQSKLTKKFQERISYVPQGSRNYLQINNKTISDFGDFNQTAILKEKLEAQLRRTQIKFVEKQYFSKEGRELIGI